MAGDSPNPLATLVSFPETLVLRRRDVIPSSRSEGIWALEIVLAMPRTIAHEYIRSQLGTSGFHDDSVRSNYASFHFHPGGHHVKGWVTETIGGSRVFLISTRKPDVTEDEA